MWISGLHQVADLEHARRLGAEAPARHAPADIVLARLQAEERVAQVAAPAVDLAHRVGIDLASLTPGRATAIITLQASSLTRAAKRNSAISSALFTSMKSVKASVKSPIVASGSALTRLVWKPSGSRPSASPGAVGPKPTSPMRPRARPRSFRHVGDLGAAGAQAHVGHPDVVAAALALEDAADARAAEGQQHRLALQRQDDDRVEEVVDQVGLQPLAALEAADDDGVEALLSP